MADLCSAMRWPGMRNQQHVQAAGEHLHMSLQVWGRKLVSHAWQPRGTAAHLCCRGGLERGPVCGGRGRPLLRAASARWACSDSRCALTAGSIIMRSAGVPGSRTGSWLHSTGPCARAWPFDWLSREASSLATLERGAAAQAREACWAPVPAQIPSQSWDHAGARVQGPAHLRIMLARRWSAICSRTITRSSPPTGESRAARLLMAATGAVLLAYSCPRKPMPKTRGQRSLHAPGLGLLALWPCQSQCSTAARTTGSLAAAWSAGLRRLRRCQTGPCRCPAWLQAGLVQWCSWAPQTRRCTRRLPACSEVTALASRVVSS